MKHLYINGRIRKFIFMIAGMVLLLSCCKGSDDLVEQAPATIKITTRVTADEDPDNAIKSLRIMAFDRGSMIRNNIFYDEGYLNSNNPIIHEMLSGIYDFIFIANETPDGSENPELTTSSFGNNKTISSLNSITIPSSVINHNNIIPMLTRVDNVTVLPGLEGIKINDGVTQNIWSVLMKRLAVRIDIILKSQADLTSQFKGVVFSNISDNIPLLGDYSGLQNTVKSYTLLANPENFEIIKGSEYLWAIKVKRIILPSNTFSPENTPSRALKMTLTLAPWSDELPSATIGIDEPSNYTLPPNTQFIGEGIVGPLLDLNLNVLDWDTKDILGDINGRILNVSAIKASITSGSTVRIYFNTNQKVVSIDPIGRFSGSSFDVNNVFESLSGNTPTNFHFTPNTGQGYIDIKAVQPISSAGNYVIYLNAGGLLRTITITVSI